MPPIAGSMFEPVPDGPIDRPSTEQGDADPGEAEAGLGRRAVVVVLTEQQRHPDQAAATDDAAALRVTLEGIRDMARRAENTNPQSDEYHDQLHIRDLLGSVAYRAVEALRADQSGVPLSVEFRQLRALVDTFEKGMQETGGWRYSGDRTLAEQVQREGEITEARPGRLVRMGHA